MPPKNKARQQTTAVATKQKVAVVPSQKQQKQQQSLPLSQAKTNLAAVTATNSNKYDVKKQDTPTLAVCESTSFCSSSSSSAAASMLAIPRGSNSHLDVDIRNLLSRDSISVGDSIQSMLRRRSSALQDADTSALSASGSKSAASTTLSIREAVGVVENFDLIYKHINTAFTECEKASRNDHSAQNEEDDLASPPSSKGAATQSSLSPISASAFDQTMKSAKLCLQLLFEALTSFEASNNSNNNPNIPQKFGELLIQNRKAWLGRFQKIFTAVFISTTHRVYFGDDMRDLYLQCLETLFSAAVATDIKTVLGKVYIEKIFVVIREMNLILEEETMKVLDQTDKAQTGNEDSDESDASNGKSGKKNNSNINSINKTSKKQKQQQQQHEQQEHQEQEQEQTRSDKKKSKAAAAPHPCLIASPRLFAFNDSSIFRSLFSVLTLSMISNPDNKNLVAMGKDILANTFKFSCDPLMQQQALEIFFRLTRNNANLRHQLPLPEKVIESLGNLPQDASLFAAILDIAHQYNRLVRRDAGRVRYYDVEFLKSGGGNQHGGDSSSVSTDLTSIFASASSSSSTSSTSPLAVFTPRSFIVLVNPAGEDSIIVDYSNIRSVRWTDEGKTLTFRMMACPATLQSFLTCGANVHDGSDCLHLRLAPASLLLLRQAPIKDWIVSCLKARAAATTATTATTTTTTTVNKNENNDESSPRRRTRSGNNNNTDKNNNADNNYTNNNHRNNINTNQDTADEDGGDQNHHDDDDDRNNNSSTNKTNFKNNAERQFSISPAKNIRMTVVAVTADDDERQQATRKQPQRKTGGFATKSVSFTSQVANSVANLNEDDATLLPSASLAAPNNSLAAPTQQHQRELHPLPQMPPQTLLRPQDQQLQATVTTTFSNSNSNKVPSLSESLQAQQHQQQQGLFSAASPTPFNPRNFMHPPNSSVKRQREQYFKNQDHDQQAQEATAQNNTSNSGTIYNSKRDVSASVVVGEDSAPIESHMAATNGNSDNAAATSPAPSAKMMMMMVMPGAVASIKSQNSSRLHSAQKGPTSVFSSETLQLTSFDDGSAKASNEVGAQQQPQREQSPSRKLPQSMSPTPVAGQLQRKMQITFQKSQPRTASPPPALEQQQHQQQSNASVSNNDSTNNIVSEYVSKLLQAVDDRIESIREQDYSILQKALDSLDTSLAAQNTKLASDNIQLNNQHESEFQALFESFCHINNDHGAHVKIFNQQIDDAREGYNQTLAFAQSSSKNCLGFVADLRSETEQRFLLVENGVSAQISALEQLIEQKSRSAFFGGGCINNNNSNNNSNGGASSDGTTSSVNEEAAISKMLSSLIMATTAASGGQPPQQQQQQQQVLTSTHQPSHTSGFGFGGNVNNFNNFGQQPAQQFPHHHVQQQYQQPPSMMTSTW